MKRDIPPMSEARMLKAEARIPELAARAGKAAHARALKVRGSVVMAEKGLLVRVHSNGDRQVLGELPPALEVKPGQVLKRKKAVHG